MIWRFVNTGYNNAAYNMTFDEQLAAHLAQGTAIPTLRVYGWQPHAISVGMNQSYDDFDHQKLQYAGIDIVKRPTGGRAILHAEELTYSVVLNIHDKSLKEIYRFINEGLLEGLRSLGINAELSNLQDNFRQLYREQASIPCFSSFAKCEIHYQGKKLVGSAQRRYGIVVLQHGSILLGPAHRKISDFLAPHVEDFRRIMEDDLLTKTTDASTILGREVGFSEAAEYMKSGFSSACQISFEEDIMHIETVC